mmetsp:Transcript_78787/g.219004  ORF Transcript_78787/g.219004 Transcript_78787/m.219004 type:complete len:343 (-) Transcript_78787:100-1128(-)
MNQWQQREEEKARLQDLSVRELRKQAALKCVPLTHISAAVEKKDLIALILRAGPVLDHYGVSTGVKVHSADSIAKDIAAGVPNKPKKKKKKRKSSHSSSSSSSSRGRRKKRSKSRRRSRSRGRKRSKSREKKKKSRSRSPSLQMISAPLVVTAPKERAAATRKPAVVDLDEPEPAPALAITDSVSTVLVDPAPAAPPSAPEGPDFARAGMAAAAALGFDVLPKRTSNLPEAPAPGLRPSINALGSAPSNSLLPGGRVCIQYIINSKCELGNKCPDAHIIDPEEEMRVRARFKDQECHFGASCTRAGCLFRHPGERVEEGAFVPEGQQVRLKCTPHGMQLSYM